MKSEKTLKNAAKKLRTGFRYPRGPWKGMSGQIWIKVANGYIVSATSGNDERWSASDEKVSEGVI